MKNEQQINNQKTPLQSSNNGFDEQTIYPNPVERDLVKSIVLESYSEFVKELWDTVVEDKLVWNWHMEYLCDEAQVLAERVIRREPKEYDLVINVPPGSSKSTIFTVMLLPWMWARDQSIQSLHYSFDAALALDLSVKCRDVILSEKYRELFPEISLRLDKASKSLFGNEKMGWRYACGAGGMVTGRHGHIQVIDDPIDPQSSYSEITVKTINRWMDNTLPSRCVDKEVTPTILVMQRLGQDDPSEHMLARDGGIPVKHICLPAEISDRVRPEECRARYIDGLLDPKRMSERILASMRGQMTPYDYACQFDQDSVPREGGTFNTVLLSKQKIHRIDWAQVVECVRFWDKAASQDKGCFTAGTLLLKYQDGRYIIGNVHKGQWEPFSCEEQIKTVAQMDGIRVPVRVEEEGGSGGKLSALTTIKNLPGYDVAAVRPQGSKEIRAIPFAAQVNGGNVWMVDGPWNKDFISELMFFPNSQYKDQVDSASGAFNHLTAGLTAGTF